MPHYLTEAQMYLPLSNTHTHTHTHYIVYTLIAEEVVKPTTQEPLAISNNMYDYARVESPPLEVSKVIIILSLQ